MSEASTLEKVTGHYLSLDLDGQTHRVYFETVGTGIPLLCLHTVGADGRQYRALVNDEDLTKKFQVIVPDMPWHGKSSPPVDWRSAHGSNVMHSQVGSRNSRSDKAFISSTRFLVLGLAPRKGTRMRWRHFGSST